MNENGNNSHIDLFFYCLHYMADQSEQAEKKTMITPEEVQRALPEGYCLGFVEIRPLNPAASADDRSSFRSDDIYRKVDNYYLLELWILEGRPDGGYTPRRLEEDIIWDETYTFLMGRAYLGGFTKEYFVGRAPFAEYQFFYEYDESSDRYLQVRSYCTCSGKYIIEDDKNWGQVSLPAYGNDQSNMFYSLEPWTLEQDVMKAYPFYQCTISELPSFTDSKKAAALKELLRDDLNEIASALNTFNEMQSPLLISGCTFTNSNILVMHYEIKGNVNVGENQAYRERTLYRMYDLNRNEKIPIREVLSFPEFMTLALLGDNSLDHPIEQYKHLEDPVYELAAQNNPMSIFLTEEGLGFLTCEGSVYPSDTYQRNLSLVPREYLLNMKISSL